MKGKKTGGRKPGSLNKATVDLRKSISALVEKNMERLESDFDELDPEKRLTLLEKYLKYTISPLSSVNVQGEIKTQLEALTDQELDILAQKIISQNTKSHD